MCGGGGVVLSAASPELARLGHAMQPGPLRPAQNGDLGPVSSKSPPARHDHVNMPITGQGYAVDDLTAHLQGLAVFSLQQQQQRQRSSISPEPVRTQSTRPRSWQQQQQQQQQQSHQQQQQQPQLPLQPPFSQPQQLPPQQLPPQQLLFSQPQQCLPPLPTNRGNDGLPMDGAMLQGAAGQYPYTLQGLLLSNSHEHSRQGSGGSSSTDRPRSGSAGSVANGNMVIHGMGSSGLNMSTGSLSPGDGGVAAGHASMGTLQSSASTHGGSMLGSSSYSGSGLSSNLGSNNLGNSNNHLAHMGFGPGGSGGRLLGGMGGPDAMSSWTGGSSSRSDSELAARAAKGSSRRRRASASSMEAASKRTVYVSCLDAQVDESFLALFFERCVAGSQVVDCRVCGDPAAEMRFAFVEFADEASTAAALPLTGTVLGMFPIRIKPSRTAIVPVNHELMPQTPVELERCVRTVYVSNIDQGVEKATLRAFFQQLCGPVVRMQQHGPDAAGPSNTNIAFIELLHAQGALAALNCNGMLLGSRPLRVAPSRTPVRTRAGGRTKRRAEAHNAARQADLAHAAAAAPGMYVDAGAYAPDAGAYAANVLTDAGPYAPMAAGQDARAYAPRQLADAGAYTQGPLTASVPFAPMAPGHGSNAYTQGPLTDAVPYAAAGHLPLPDGLAYAQGVLAGAARYAHSTLPDGLPCTQGPEALMLSADGMLQM